MNPSVRRRRIPRYAYVVFDAAGYDDIDGPYQLIRYKFDRRKR